MYDIEKLLSASMADMERGYAEESDCFECLLCGFKTEKGIIYKEDDRLYEAEKYMAIHIRKAHGSVFEFLLGLDKKITGLSEHQSRLLKLFYEGRSDAEIQKETGIGSSSTVRNHRFALREKERQAKVFLTLMSALKNSKRAPALIPPHENATMVDDRYNITDEENDTIIKKYFPQGVDGPLKTFTMKEKSRIAVLRQLIRRFENGRIYTEKEVNEILKGAYDDFATLRRYMIEYGFMKRKRDGSQYWVNIDNDGPKADHKSNVYTEKKKDNEGNEDKNMDADRKRELLEQYKHMKKKAGVYQIRNKVNNKILVIATPDLKSINGKKFQLELGSFVNKELQRDWNEYGEDSFAFEILEELDEDKEGFTNKTDELKKLEKKWLDNLQPFGANGYNKEKHT